MQSADLTVGGAKMGLERIGPSIALIDEDATIESIARIYRHYGYSVKKQVKLKYGIVDLFVVKNRKALLIEVKFKSGFHAVAHALGQILLYREQIDTSKFDSLKCVIHVGDVPKKARDFLKRTCARYSVDLVYPEESE